MARLATSESNLLVLGV